MNSYEHTTCQHINMYTIKPERDVQGKRGNVEIRGLFAQPSNTKVSREGQPLEGGSRTMQTSYL